MGATTSIEWTATVHPDGSVTPGKTWNPVTGCDKVSPGCKNCYAEGVANRFWAKQYPPVRSEGTRLLPVPHDRPRQFTDVMTHEDRLLEPLSWRKPARVFVNSMSDLFHEDVPDAFIDKVFAVMALAPQHTFQILTKRPAWMREYVSTLGLSRLYAACRSIPKTSHHRPRPSRIDLPLPNVWLGVSVENQHFADERIPLLLQTPAAVRFISAEPLLGPVDLDRLDLDDAPCEQCRERVGYSALVPMATCGCTKESAEPYDSDSLDWVIVGGESGPGARPFDLAWARSIVAQCKAAGVPVFVKQLGANAVSRNDERDEGWPGSTVPIDDDYEPRYQGETAPLCFRDRKGGDITEFPSDLQVREFPTVT